MKCNSTSRFLTGLLLSLGFSTAVMAQATNMQPRNKPYWSTNIDGLILSSAIDQSDLNMKGESVGTPRFTGFFHIGANLNYDLGKNVGIFTGINIKNIGFIEKFSNPDSTVKRRVYTLGVPLGIKLGNIKYGSFLIAGGGVDFPFNFKEKGFVNRGDKKKFNEWFSSRTPAVMPYVFIGAYLRPVMAIKLQYYPTNFLNPNYTETDGTGAQYMPYKNYDVKLIMLTLGFDINYKPRT